MDDQPPKSWIVRSLAPALSNRVAQVQVAVGAVAAQTQAITPVDQLDKIGAETGKCQSELVRGAIVTYLARQT